MPNLYRNTAQRGSSTLNGKLDGTTTRHMCRNISQKIKHMMKTIT